MSDSDDDRPISDLIKKRTRAREIIDEEVKAKKRKPDNSIDIDDDDKPISKLTNKKAKLEHSEVGKVDEKQNKEKRESSSKKSTNSLATEFYSDTTKGMLVQRFLVRWWYSMEWPQIDDIGTPPAGYEPLEGFIGVFISTKSESLGNIVDLRNKESCPSLRNVSSWSCDKIKLKCIEAYENQMKILKDIEEESTLLNSLRKELKEVKSIDVQKAEKEAKKYQFRAPT